MATDAERIIELYERHAHAWDSDRGSELVGESVWLDRSLGLLPPGASVLDLGCGSGQPIARQLIGRKFQVLGVDSSATLIALCRHRFPEHEWIIGFRQISAQQARVRWERYRGKRLRGLQHLLE